MKKVFLGLFLAGTMMSFANLNAETTKELDEFPGCCTHISRTGNKATSCTQSTTDANCNAAKAAVAILDAMR